MYEGGLGYYRVLRCCAVNIETTEPDSLGHVFCLLECDGCSDKNFCLSVKRVVEEELNRRLSVQEALKKY